MAELTRQGTYYTDGDLEVCGADYVAQAGERILVLPRRVLFLLFELSRRPGAVRTRTELAEGAWALADGEVNLKSVDQAVSRLRRGLTEALPDLTYIHTHPGVGYRFERLPRDPRDGRAV